MFTVSSTTQMWRHHHRVGGVGSAIVGRWTTTTSTLLPLNSCILLLRQHLLLGTRKNQRIDCYKGSYCHGILSFSSSSSDNNNKNNNSNNNTITTTRTSNTCANMEQKSSSSSPLLAAKELPMTEREPVAADLKRKSSGGGDAEPNEQPQHSKHQSRNNNKKQKKYQPNPRKNRRTDEFGEDVSATINKGSLANPEMQLPQFGYYGAVDDKGDDEKDKAAAAVVGDDDDQQQPSHLVKRRVALVIGFVGSRYHGFQMNPQQPTLQAVLEYALYRAKYISPSNFGVPFKYGWSHSARTDRGVHAAAQVCSCKLQVPQQPPSPPKQPSVAATTTPATNDGDGNTATPNPPQKPKQPNNGGGNKKNDKDDDDNDDDDDGLYDTVIRERINHYLPNDIRILQVIRTTRNFCARNLRDQVRYQYCFPSFVLMPDFASFWQQQLQQQTQSGGGGGVAIPTSASDPITIQEWQDKLRPLVQDYRITNEQMQMLQQTMQVYQGTNSYHCFTKGVERGSAQALRFIIHCSVRKQDLPIPTATITTTTVTNDTTTTTTSTATTELNVDGNTDNNNPSSSTSSPPLPTNGTMEWIMVDIVGQSFLLNQIRKMMSMAMDVTRGKAPLTTLTRMLERRRGGGAGPKGGNNNNDDDNNKEPPVFRVGVAPAQGLFLDLSYYHSYNRKCPKLKLQPLLDQWDERERRENEESSNNNSNNNNNNTTNEKKEEEKEEDGYQRWKSFKQKVILPHMVQEEWEQGNFMKYLLQQEFFFDHVSHYQLEEEEQQQQQDATTNEG